MTYTEAYAKSYVESYKLQQSKDKKRFEDVARMIKSAPKLAIVSSMASFDSAKSYKSEDEGSCALVKAEFKISPKFLRFNLGIRYWSSSFTIDSVKQDGNVLTISGKEKDFGQEKHYSIVTFSINEEEKSIKLLKHSKHTEMSKFYGTYLAGQKPYIKFVPCNQ